MGKSAATSIVNHVEALAERACELAELYACAELAGWGDELCEEVERFAVEEMQETLAMYPQLCVRLGVRSEENRP